MPKIKSKFNACIEFDDSKEFYDFIDLIRRLSNEGITFYEGNLRITSKDVTLAKSIMNNLEDE